MARLSPAATIASRGKAVVGEVRVRDQLTDELLSLFSQPISNQTQISQPLPAATKRRPQRCTRSIPYCQRTIHDARPWPASFRLPMLQANLSQLRSMTEREPVVYLCKRQSCRNPMSRKDYSNCGLL